MFLNSEIFLLLNIYFFDNLIFIFDKFSVLNEINDILFIFFYAFLVNKSILYFKDDFKKFFFNTNNSTYLKLNNSQIIFFYKYFSKSLAIKV